jgi:hypothetical protein
MEPISLRSAQFAVTCEPKLSALRVSPSPARARLAGGAPAGAEVTWLVDLSAAALETRRPDSASARHSVRLADLTLRRLSASRVQWIGSVGDAECAFEIAADQEGVLFTVTPLGGGEADIVSAVWPGEIRLEAAHREICWSNYQQGALFFADGRPWEKQVTLDHVPMRAFGLSSAEASLAAIVETPADAAIHFADDGGSTALARVEFLPSMGSLAYTRRLRLVPLPERGHVAIAQAFRSYAQRHGLWMSWEERVSQNPAVANLQGAFVACAGYWFDPEADQVGVMRKMRDYGFSRGYLFSPKMIVQTSGWTGCLHVEPNHLTDEQLAQINSLGYLTAPFLQVEEADDSFQRGRYFARGADGNRIRRWQIGDQHFFEIVKWHVPPNLAGYEDQLQVCNAIHFDTLTAMSLVEHHGERSYDRRGDAALRLDIAQHYRDRGKVIVSEGLRDWAIRTVDMGTGKAFTPLDPGDRRVWIVPLSDLVYHDSCPRISWEHHPYDDDRCVHSLFQKRFHPFGGYLTDLLTCSPPVLFPEGMLYEFAHREVAREDGEMEWEIVWDKAAVYRKRFTDHTTQEALPKALHVCRLHERHGAARMTSHRFLDDSYRCVQESEFASGLHVIVNFGDEPYALPDGRTVGARSALTEE